MAMLLAELGVGCKGLQGFGYHQAQDNGVTRLLLSLLKYSAHLKGSGPGDPSQTLLVLTRQQRAGLAES